MKSTAERFTDALARALGVDHHRMSAAGGVDGFLDAAMQRAGAASPEELVEEAQRDPQLWAELVGVVLNGQTYFYRDPGQIDALAGFLEERTRAAQRAARVWCAGCSTGEEPLTIAIECARRGIDLHVVGSDVNPAALRVARDGRYFAWKLRHVQPAIAATAFIQERDTFHVQGEVRARVEWAEHNLLADAAPLLQGRRGDFDLVVCRNVLIYYAADDVTRIVRRLLDATSTHGVVALGASELVMNVEGSELVRAHDRLFLRRAGARVGPSPPAHRPRLTATLPTATLPTATLPTATRAIATMPSASMPSATSFLMIEDDVVQKVAVGDLAGGIAALERVVAASPSDLLCLHALAQLRIATHDLDGAARALDLAEQLDALEPDLHLARGLLARKRGDWEGARAALQRSLFLDPRSWLASYLSWGALLRLGRDGEAQVERRRASALLADARAAARMRTFGPFFSRIAPSADECRAALATTPRRR